MHSHLRLFTLSAAVAAAAATITAAAADGSGTAINADSASVATVVSDFHDALSKGDSARALVLLAPDAIVLESGGLETRSEYRSHHLPADIAFARAVSSKRSPLQVVVDGTTAWTAGTSTTQGEFNARAVNSVGAESMVLTKGREGWRIRSIHWSSRNRRPPAP